MTVAELITLLQEMPPDAPVILCDDAEGLEWHMVSADIYSWPDGTKQVEFR